MNSVNTTTEISEPTPENETPISKAEPPKAEPPKAEPPKTITKKEKNPKRVEQGKKLAEWNRHKKERLKQKNTLEVELKDTPEPASELNYFVQNSKKTNQPKDQFNYWFLGGTIVIGGIAVGLIYFIQRGETIQPEPKQLPKEVPKPKENDPFNMD